MATHEGKTNSSLPTTAKSSANNAMSEDFLGGRNTSSPVHDQENVQQWDDCHAEIVVECLHWIVFIVDLIDFSLHFFVHSFSKFGTCFFCHPFAVLYAIVSRCLRVSDEIFAFALASSMLTLILPSSFRRNNGSFSSLFRRTNSANSGSFIVASQTRPDRVLMVAFTPGLYRKFILRSSLFKKSLTLRTSVICQAKIAAITKINQWWWRPSKLVDDLQEARTNVSLWLNLLGRLQTQSPDSQGPICPSD